MWSYCWQLQSPRQVPGVGWVANYFIVDAGNPIGEVIGAARGDALRCLVMRQVSS
jgi:hypothetical protein